VAWAYLVLSAAASSGTLGFDYKAYDLAVDHLLAGQTMYDPTATETGSFGLFFYPPPFAVMVMPFALLPVESACWRSRLFLVAAAVVAIWILPVSGRTRLAVGSSRRCRGRCSTPIKLGQVWPLILLTFALGWRWLDRPWGLGLSAAVGAVIKIQPALVLGWAVVTGRRRAAVIGVVAVAVIAAVATVVAGPRSCWRRWTCWAG
jgi:alpha-1,2-mannosyltransferase